MNDLKGRYRKHVVCGKTREAPATCVACFALNYGDPLAERRCWYCSTDAFHSKWWGDWRITADGHLACGQCATHVEKGEQRFIRSVSTYRARFKPYEPGTRALDTYCSLKDLKDHLSELGPILVTPFGNVLAESVLRLMREEKLGRGLLLVPAPASTPERQHARALTEQAAKSLNGVPLGLDVLRSGGVGESKAMDLAGRQARDTPEVTGKVARRVVIVTDDFYTSGETQMHCAEALLAAGADRVYGATVARVVNPPEPERVSDGSEFLTGTFTEIAWSEMRDRASFVVNKETERVRLRFGCSGCAAVLTPDDVPTGADVPTLKVKCETCGGVHELRVTWQNRRTLSATLKGRRTSEMIVSQHGK